MKKAFNSKVLITAVFLAVIFAFMGELVLDDGPSIYKKVKKAVKQERALEESDLFSMAQAGIRETENQLNENFPKKMTFINIHGLFNRILGKKQMVEPGSSLNNVYKMDNGQLTYSYRMRNLEFGYGNMKDLKQLCEEKGASFMYLQFPFKVEKGNNLLPHGMKDTSNRSCNKFLRTMDRIGVPYIDYRIALKEAGKFGEDYADLFFDTDHHWKTETAFWAADYFMKHLEENYGYAYNEENGKAENFEFVTLKDSFIGSRANRTGLWYGGIDDFTYIYPRFETDYLWEKYNQKGEKMLVRNGAFEDTLLFKEILKNPETPKAYRDNCYFNGNPTLTEITNNKVKEGSILVVSDSFGKPFNSFLSLNFHKTVCIDLRSYQGSLLEYVQNNSFDYVVVAYNASAYKDQSYKKFFGFSE